MGNRCYRSWRTLSRPAPELASAGTHLNLTARKHRCMTTRRNILGSLTIVAFAGAFASTAALADIYTWVDASGNLNLSNQEPPKGARITNVVRESPEAKASADAARAAAQREELRALNERVGQLERDLETAKNAPPPPPPGAYAPAVAALPPTFVAQTIVVPSAPAYAPPAPAYADCWDAWGSCAWPGLFGFYPSGVVVLNAPRRERIPPIHREPHPRPPAFPAFPKPVGVLPDPPNLFPK